MISSSSPVPQALNNYLATSYDVLKHIHEHLDEIIRVASHLTPVEDLVDFRNQIEALHAQLELLTNASELMVQVSVPGINLMLAPTTADQRTFLGLGTAAQQDSTYFATQANFAALQATVTTISNNVGIIQATLLTLATTAYVDGLNTGQQTSINTLISGLAAAVVRLDADDVLLASHTASLGTLDGRVTVIEGDIVGISGQISTWEGDLLSLDGVVTAQGSAISILDSRITVNDGQIDTISTSVTTLEADLTTANGQITAHGTAISTLTTQVSANDIQISINSSDITSLSSQVDNVEAGQSAQATAISALTTDVTALEGGMASNSAAITTLSASISGISNLVPNSAFAFSTRNWAVNSRGTGWATAPLARDLLAFSMLPLGTHTLCLTASGVPSGTVSFRSDPMPAQTGVEYIASGYPAGIGLTTRIDITFYNAANGVTGTWVVGSSASGEGGATLTDWVRKHLKVTAPAGTVSMRMEVWGLAIASADPHVLLLRPMVEEARPGQTLPSPWVDGLAGLEEVTATATSALEVSVNSITGVLNAQYSLVLDVDGYISGFESVNDGSTAEFIIRADTFKLVTPGETPIVPFSVSDGNVNILNDLNMTNGRIVARSAGFMKVQGIGFGTTNQFLEWFGPLMAINLCSEANAICYCRVDGVASYAGAVTTTTPPPPSSGSTTITLTQGTWQTGQGDVATTCTFQMGNTGILSLIEDGLYTAARPANNWMIPASAYNAALYECKVDILTGTFSAGSASTGVWLGLGTTREWKVSKGNTTGGYYKTCTFNIQVRLIATPGVILAGPTEMSITAYYEGIPGVPSECVLTTSYLPDGRRAGDVQVGDDLHLAHSVTLEQFMGTVQASAAHERECIRLLTQGGAGLGCSLSAPIPVPEGYKPAGQLQLGDRVPVMIHGNVHWDPIIELELLGMRWVQRITVQDECFWAGDTEDKFILHHNIRWKEEPPP